LQANQQSRKNEVGEADKIDLYKKGDRLSPFLLKKEAIYGHITQDKREVNKDSAKAKREKIKNT